VLFLDELPEFKRHVLEVLRQPLEQGVVTVARAAASLTFPARFMLVAAMNPCPCGYYGDPHHACVCSSAAIRRYRGRVSGPLLDRFDLHVDVPAVRSAEMASPGDEEASNAVRERVVKARRAQAARYEGQDYRCNAQLSSRAVRRYCTPGTDAQELLGHAMDRLGLSARAYTRALKVARTVADLQGAERVGREHVLEALQFRKSTLAIGEGRAQ